MAIHGSRLLRRASNACLYLAVGLRSHDDLASDVRAQYVGFGADPDYARQGLTPFESRTLGTALPRQCRVLVIGCGPGRELIALRSQGFVVEGVDPSPESIDRARQNLLEGPEGVRLHVGRFEDVAFEGTFPGIVFSDSCYSQIQGSSRRIEALRKAARLVDVDGRVVIYYLRTDRYDPMASGLMMAGAVLARAAWRPEPGDSFSAGVSGAVTYTHYFCDGDVAAECEAAGLVPIAEDTSGRLRCLVSRRLLDRPQGT